MRRYKPLALFLSVLCLLCSLSVGGHATGVPLSDNETNYYLQRDIPYFNAMGYDVDINTVEVVDCSPEIALFGMDDYPKFNVLCMAEGVSPKYYTNVSFVSPLKNTGMDISKVVAVWTSQAEYDFNTSNEFTCHIEWEHKGMTALDFRIVSGVDETIATFYYQPGVSHDNSNLIYDISFVPTMSCRAPLIFSHRDLRFSSWTGYTYRVALNDFVIEWENKDDRLVGKIQGFFSDLGDKITNWFNQLKDWIKAIPDKITEMINSVGDWFQNIIDSVGQWFSDLLQSFTDWWQSVKDWFHDLFTIPDGFGNEYKSQWDSWMSEHFGFLYQSIDMVTGVFNRIIDGIKNDRHIIKWPEIKMPLFDKSTLIPANDVDLDGFISQHGFAKTLYDVYIVGIWGTTVMALMIMAYRKYQSITGGRD